jgi:hypothetical protein
MRTITLLTLALALLLPLTTSAEVRLTFSRSKARPGDVTLKLQGAGRTQRVTVPWKVAYDLAWKAKHNGGVKVTTARDGFTGNMLRLVAGEGKDAMIVDRMRRGGPNGQSGASALRIQVGLGRYARAFHFGRTVAVGTHKDFGVLYGRSGPARKGMYPAKVGDLSLDLKAWADGSTMRWYFKQTKKITTDPNAPLVSFAPYGLPKNSAPVTAQPARLIGADAILGD